MRGAGDYLSVGERIAFFRRRRGLSQRVLAGLVGRSEDWLSKIERGERQLSRVEVIAEVARSLRVSLGDLIGEPVLLEDPFEDDDVPAVRDALMAPSRLSAVLFDGPPASDPRGLPQLASRAEWSWSDYQAGRVGRVVAELPNLIQSAQVAEDADVSEGWAVSARIHHLAATTLAKVGEADLSWIASERAMAAADRSGDPLVLASAARSAAHALLAVGRYQDAVQLAETAASWLVGQVVMDDPDALCLLGMLRLRTSIAAARHDDRATASDMLRLADEAASRLGEDSNRWATAFGPTNVELHRTSVALDLGDVAYVAEHGPSVDVHALPPERVASHRIDVARAQSYLAQDEEAVTTLLAAEADAPQLVRHNPAVREVVRAIHRRSPVTTGSASSPVLALAQRCRAV